MTPNSDTESSAPTRLVGNDPPFSTHSLSVGSPNGRSQDAPELDYSTQSSQSTQPTSQGSNISAFDDSTQSTSSRSTQPTSQGCASRVLGSDDSDMIRFPPDVFDAAKIEGNNRERSHAPTLPHDTPWLLNSFAAVKKNTPANVAAVCLDDESDTSQESAGTDYADSLLSTQESSSTQASLTDAMSHFTAGMGSDDDVTVPARESCPTGSDSSRKRKAGGDLLPWLLNKAPRKSFKSRKTTFFTDKSIGSDIDMSFEIVKGVEQTKRTIDGLVPEELQHNDPRRNKSLH
ncbi:hypothetical protein C8F04DRAFT_623722 [Mycena alexandri]|uniref:Uncharacterized protein n=1 Tax=Mycena alexandri TaxID=1745969 RepID=A0AAD6X1R0_9AGAR|nr:hypothetical protein C8F04DRAFT_623722 [Mycena alexandri]